MSGPTVDPQEAMQKVIAQLRASKVDSATLQALEGVAAKLADDPASQPEPASPAFLTAATRASFTVSELRGAIATGSHDLPAAGDISPVLNSSVALAGLPGDSEQRYLLSDSAREKVLKGWQDSGALAASIDAAASAADPETRFLGQFLQNRHTVDIESMTQTEMLAATRAASMVSRVRPEVEPVQREMRRRLDLEEIISPLRVLIRKKSPVGEGLGPDVFYGRSDQLLELYGHVGIRPPESIREALGRAYRSLKRAVTGAPTGTLVVHAIGGMGKSALIARFVLEHVRRDEHWLPFAYLDFDRSTLASAPTSALLIEVMRQVALQIGPPIAPEVADRAIEQLRLLRSELREDLLAGATHGAEGCVPRFREVVDTFAASRPFLIVLDTVERLQSQGAEGVKRLRDLLGTLGLFAGSWPRLRVVVCSRMDVPELRSAGPPPIALGAMGTSETRGVARKVLADLMPGRSVAKELVAAIANASRGYPLFVRVLAMHVAKAGLDSDEELIRELQSTKGRASRVATVLYTRFADRIALPGGAATFKVAACLRTVTPEQLAPALRALAPDMSDADIAAAFGVLHDDETLWAEREAGRLRWRPELRLLLLGCIKDESDGPSGTLQRVAEVTERTLAELPTSDETAADAVYYALLAGRGVAYADRYWRPGEGFRLDLVDAAQDFPAYGAEATYLRLLAGTRRMPDGSELSVIPAGIGWRLAWTADVRLAKPGGDTIDPAILTLADAAPSIKRSDLAFNAQRVALLAKTGRWSEATRLLSKEIIAQPADRVGLVHWYNRTAPALLKAQFNALMLPLLDDIRSDSGDQPTSSPGASSRIEALVAILVATRTMPHTLFDIVDRSFQDPALIASGTSTLTIAFLVGSFGEESSDWAVDLLHDRMTLNAVSSRQVAILLDASKSLGLGLTNGSDELVAAASGPARSLTDRFVLSSVLSILRRLRESGDQARRHAVFRAFFSQRNPDWIEPFAYVLASLFAIHPSRRSALLGTIRLLAEAGTLAPEMVSRAEQVSSFSDATDVLRMMDEAGALDPFLATLRDQLTQDEGLFARLILQIRSLVWHYDDPSRQRIADFLKLIFHFKAWIRLKERLPALNNKASNFPSPS
jgi:hypothetical protein